MTTHAHYDPGDARARYGWSDDDEAWRRRAEDFAAERLAPDATARDRAGGFDRALALALGEAGLLGASLPRARGGGSATTVAACLVAEELGAVDGSARGFLAVQVDLVARTVSEHGTDAQRATWLPGLLDGSKIGGYALTEPEAGSDVGAIRTRATPDGDGVVIDGEKVWITNGGVADVLLVFASADPSAGTRGLECHLVPGDAPGLSRAPVGGEAVGHRASDHARLVFEGVHVPRASRLGAARGGFAVAMGALAHGRLHVAAGAVGIHRACLDVAVDFARRRRQFGSRIGDFQQVGATLAEMATSLEASRALVLSAARQADLGLEHAGAASAAKLVATEAALGAATRAIQIVGSRAYTDELPLGRHWRDAVALTIYEGTSNVQRLILARRLLGKDEEART